MKLPFLSDSTILREENESDQERTAFFLRRIEEELPKYFIGKDDWVCVHVYHPKPFGPRKEVVMNLIVEAYMEKDWLEVRIESGKTAILEPTRPRDSGHLYRTTVHFKAPPSESKLRLYSEMQVERARQKMHPREEV